MATSSHNRPPIKRRPANKRARRLSTNEHRVVAEHELEQLAKALRSICAQHDGVQTVLQLDFIRSESGPRCVLRVATAPRTWMKAGEGPWHEGHLQALIGRGMLESVDRARWGTTLLALPRLLVCV
jgi:hypothetical protein